MDKVVLCLGHRRVADARCEATTSELSMTPKVEAKLTGQEMRAEQGSLSWLSAREFWEKRPFLLTVVVILTVGSPFAGLFLSGWPGVIVGLLVSVITAGLSLLAVTKVREVTCGP